MNQRGVTQKSNTGGRVSAAVAFLKDLFTLVKEVAIVVVVLLFLVFMTTNRGALQNIIKNLGYDLPNARLQELNIAGMKFSLNTARDGAQKLDSARETLEASRKTIEDLKSRSKDASLQQNLNELLKKIDAVSTSANSAQQDLHASVQQAETALTAVASSSIRAEGKWVIIVSADKQKGEAEYEAHILGQLGFPNPTIYLRKGWLRTVVSFNNRADAEKGLDTIRSKRRASAYIANMSTWCPQTQKDEAVGYFACSGGMSGD